AAENDLMANLLHDNKIVEDAKKRSQDYVSEDPQEAAEAEALLASTMLSGLGHERVRKALQEYSHHSPNQMRAESDEILKAIEATPFSNYRSLSDWADDNLPQLLKSLKDKQVCAADCTSNTKWPPINKGERDKILPKDNDTGMYGVATVKNGILAYFHGL